MADTQLHSVTGGAYIIIDSDDNENAAFTIYGGSVAAANGLLQIHESQVFKIGDTASPSFYINWSTRNIYLDAGNWTLRHASHTANNDLAIEASDDLTLEYGAYASAGTPTFEIHKNGTRVFQLNNSGNGIFENDVAVKSQLIVGSSNNPAASAALEILSTTGALLLPRMTDGQRDALTGVDGMVVYNTTVSAVQARVSGAWTALGHTMTASIASLPANIESRWGVALRGSEPTVRGRAQAR